MHPRFSLLAALGLILVASLPLESPSSSSPLAEPPDQTEPRSLRQFSPFGAAMMGRVPIAFVPNLGQWEQDFRYLTRLGPMTVFLQERGWSFTLVERQQQEGAALRDSRRDALTTASGVAVRMTFVGDQQPEIVAEQVLPGRHHYFLGADPTKWRSDVPRYGAVRYCGMLDGVDVRAREHDGRFEYDLLLAPGVDLTPIEIVVEGADALRIAADGALVMTTALGDVCMPLPVSWEERQDGERTPIACRYELRERNRFGFVTDMRHPDRALVVDPGLVWSTYLGGSHVDYASGVTVSASGEATVTGASQTPSFPTTLGTFQSTMSGPIDAFVTRISPDGATLIYSTFLGGTGDERATAVALAAHGEIVFCGMTTSANFPATPGAFDVSFNYGFEDGFVARLSATGSNLVYATYLGGNGINGDWVSALGVGPQGDVIVTGSTWSANFPVTAGAPQPVYGGNTDAFVTCLSANGANVLYSTFLGSGGYDHGSAIAVDYLGRATVVGFTNSATFPTTPGALQTIRSGLVDSFVSKLSASGITLYTTLLGGSGGAEAMAVAVDDVGNATIGGRTNSTDFPTTPLALDTTYSGQSDGFVTRLSPNGSSLVWSTYLGGVATDGCSSLALDPRGATTVAGYTGSTDFPTTPGAFDVSFNGGSQPYDGFVARLSPAGSALEYASFLGGSGDEGAAGVALAPDGAAIVVGDTSSSDFPTTPGAFSTNYGGGANGIGDAFIARLDLLPTGVAAFGSSTPGCRGPLSISATSMPRVGNAGFALACGNAAPYATGAIAFSSAALASPIPTLGALVWIDPSAQLVSATVISDAVGGCEVSLPIPANPTLAGLRLFTQFFWLGPSTPAPCPTLGLSASHALAITIQP